MKESKQEDEMLERLLAGLGGTPVDDGFAQRVTHGIEARVEARTAAGIAARTTTQVRWRGPVWAFAATVAAMLLCVAAVHEVRHRSDPRPIAGTPPRVAQPGVLPASPVPPTVADGAGEPFVPLRKTPVQAKTVSLIEQPAAAPPVSFPAPEAPLTEQERLLLRIVHRGDPVEIAMLNPQELAREEAAEAAAFQKFFPPPPPPANDVPDDPMKVKGDQK